MSRRLIITLLVILIVGVVLGTGYFVILRLRGSASSTATPTPAAGGLQPASNGSQVAITDPTGDSDHDGLTNADEAIWGTDPLNPDTDHDGYTDGEEVKAGHNPTIPAPNDKLPDGFVPGQNLQPLTPAANQPIAVDQFFKDNLDLSLGTKNYTNDYNQQYAQDKRTKATLADYVAAQPVASQLPTPNDKSILTGADDSATNVASYLSAIKNAAVFSNRPLFQTAVDDLFGNSDPSTVQGLAITMRSYRDRLLLTTTPPTAVPLQKLLLGYTEVLANTFDQMAKYNQDKIRALVAMHQWEVADAKYVPLIEQEVKRLKALSASQ